MRSPTRTTRTRRGRKYSKGRRLANSSLSSSSSSSPSPSSSLSSSLSLSLSSSSSPSSFPHPPPHIPSSQSSQEGGSDPARVPRSFLHHPPSLRQPLQQGLQPRPLSPAPAQQQEQQQQQVAPPSHPPALLPRPQDPPQALALAADPAEAAGAAADGDVCEEAEEDGGSYAEILQRLHVPRDPAAIGEALGQGGSEVGGDERCW
eukprot:763065-Hanusia_phi.AAC.1